MRSLFRVVLVSTQILLCAGALAQEICDNALDDDGDDLFDLNDPDCDCAGFGNTSTLPSLIPNSSFEDNSCCPSSYTQLYCADTWIQASNPTSDYWNTCGQAGSSFDGVAALPIPDGSGFVGFINMAGWQEYVGACLNQTMDAGQEYDLSFYVGYTNNSPALDLTFYGSPNCSDLPFNSNDCPMGLGSWVQLGQINIGGSNSWEPTQVTFTPSVDINALVIGGACGSGGARTYYYLDDLSLISTETFEVLHLDRTGAWCDNDILLTAWKDTAIGTYQWYMDGVALVGQTGANLDISGGGYGEGDYTIALLINDQCESITTTVTAPDLPVAAASVTEVCSLEDVDFTDLSTLASGNITDWYWDFGDATSSGLQDPTHQYATFGDYNVSLTVTTDSNCVDTWQGMVSVHATPSAAFSANSQCLYTAVPFQDQSTIANPDIITSWQWDFGDGNTAAIADPSNTYAGAGTYNVELIVSSNSSCADTVEQTIDVYDVPVADFNFDVVCAQSPTSFTDASGIATGAIVSYGWDLDLGNTSALQNPTTTYNDGGSYSVELLVISDQGCRDSLTQAVAVLPRPTAEFTVTDVCQNVANTFTDQSTINIGTISQWDWDLGDAVGTSTDQNPTYVYATGGQFTVTLTATTLDGCTDVISHTAEVFDLPVADFNFTDICEDDSAQFMDASSIPTGMVTGWQWDFGNGNASNAQNPALQPYANDATYPVSLIVLSDNGCSDTLADVIEIFPVPIADFEFDSACFPLEIEFTDLSDPNGAYAITGWTWDFSDGQTSGVQSPLVAFPAAGTYSADLLITNAAGCKSSFSDGDAVVHPVPVADFPAGLATCFEDTIFFIDQSSVTPITDDVIDVWNWDLDDGNTSTVPSPVHQYGIYSLYDVQLEVVSNHGCMHSITRMVEIYPLPEVSFSADPQFGCAPLEVQFLDGSSIPPPYELTGWNWHLGTDSTGSTYPNPFLTYNPEMDPLDSAVYDIGLTMTSGNGCVSDTLIPDYITVHPKPEALFSVDDDVKTILRPVFQFTDLSTENVTIWAWDLGDGGSSDQQHPEHTYPDVPASYPIVLMVETDFGCRDTIPYEVKVEPVYTFYIPSSFTPDDDGHNEFFYGQGEYYDEYNMYIYDRWGEMIFESADDRYPWDGTYKGEQVQQGTYIYRFYIIDWQGHDHEYEGTVTLHR